MYFKTYNEESAPEASQAQLKNVKKGLGMIPNLMASLAEAPAVLESYLLLDKQMEKTSFDPKEVQAMYLAINYENECHYCMAAHTALAKKAGLADHIIEALRDGKDVDDKKIGALVSFTRKTVEKRGWLEKEDLNSFLDAGYNKANIQEVVLAVAHKTISNYINHINETEVDEAFQDFKWKKS